MHYLVLVASIALAMPGTDTSGSVDVRSVAPGRYPEVSVVVQVSDAHGRAVPGLGPADLQLTEDGQPINSYELRPSYRDGGNAAVSLLIDKSGSMAGAAIAGAISGAQSFLERLVPEDTAEVIVFGDPIEVMVPFGPADRIAGLEALTAEGDTALYDAINRSLIDVQSQPAAAQSIVVLTDGRDDGSELSFESVRDAAAAAQVPIHAIGLPSKAFDPGPLRELSTVSGGTYREVADPAQLAEVYRDIASELQPEYRLTFQSAAGPGPHRVGIVATTSELSATGESVVEYPGSTLAGESDDVGSPLGTILLPAALVVALLTVAGVVLALRSRRSPMGLVHPPAPSRANETSFVLEGSGVSISVTRAPMIIGRDPGAQVIVDDAGVSRHHARLELASDGLWLEDLNSVNGTLVNGVPVSRHLLQMGDQVEIGELQVQVRGVAQP